MKIDLTKAFKNALGVAISVILAYVLGLQNAVSAGIITILSIQDTKKETVRLAWKRVVCFIVAIVFAFACFKLLGYTIWSFSLFVLLYIPFCQFFKSPESISVSAVLVSHFLLKQDMSINFIFEEILILVIGVSIGIIINMFSFRGEEGMRKEQAEMDEAFRECLHSLSLVIAGEADALVLKDSLEIMEQESEHSREKAFRLMGNSMLADQSYYMKYFELRQGQYFLLKQIYNHLVRLDYSVEEAIGMSKFIKEYARTLHECNDGSRLLAKAKEIKETHRGSQLPTSREEFEARAILVSVFDDIIHMLEQKVDFVSKLTPEQRDKFIDICMFRDS